MGKRRSERIRHKERKLFERYSEDRNDLRAREALVRIHMPLAESVAKRFLRRDEPLEDLMQVGYIGLLKAVDRFDPERGNSFSSYAVALIVGEIQRYFRDYVWSAKVSRGVKELCKEIEETRLELIRQNKRFPSVAEVAEALGISLEMVRRADMAWESKSPSSLSSFSDEDEGSGLPPDLESRASGYDSVELWDSLRPALALLSDKERNILHLRFFKDLTQDGIADEVECSQYHISRLLGKVFELIREKLEENGLDCVEKVG